MADMERFRHSLTAEISGDLYRQCLRLVAAQSHEAYLIVRHSVPLSALGARIVEDMHAFERTREETTSWPGTQLLGGDSATRIVCRPDGRFLDWALSLTGALYEWGQPDLPEDLGFLRSDGSVWLASISHERDAFMDLSLEEHHDLDVHVPALARLLVRDP